MHGTEDDTHEGREGHGAWHEQAAGREHEDRQEEIKSSRFAQE